MKKPDKNKSMINDLIKENSITTAIENSIIKLLSQKKNISIKSISLYSGLANSDVKILFPYYMKQKRCRTELRCSWVEKKRWELKADESGKSVSELAASSLNSLNIYVPRTEQLHHEINLLIAERIRFNNHIEQFVHKSLTSRISIELVHVLAELSDLQKKFDLHDQKVMAQINKNHVYDSLGQRYDTDGVNAWRIDE